MDPESAKKGCTLTEGHVTANTSGFSTAATMAYNMGLIPFAMTDGNESYFEAEKPVPTMLNWMHDALDWIQA